LTRKYDVLLAGYYGFGNLGDELLAEACVKLLEDNGVSRDRIAVLSADPGKTRESLGTASYDRWKLGEIRRAMKDSNSMLLGGGGLFQDRTSLRSCFYYWSLIRMARISSVKCWAVGQSLGPFNTTLGPYFAKKRVWKVRIQEREEQKLTGDAEQLGILRHTVPGSCHVPQGKEGF